MRCLTGIVMGVLLLGSLALKAEAGKPVRKRGFHVVIWDERQLAQKQIYPNFLGNHIADYLRQQAVRKEGQEPDFTVQSVGLEDPDQGLPTSVLEQCDVLIWWGHQRHGEVKPELAKEIAKRVKEGKLSLIALHSAHWSAPFMETMNERAVLDALKSLPAKERANAKIERIPAEHRLPSPTEPKTPSFTKLTNTDGTITLQVKLPLCVFPFVRGDGKPSHVKTLLPNHPIAKEIPETFDIPHTEMYGEPFHVPEPDAVVFEERWDAGEYFRAGCVWKVGQGHVFYFRPGHETFDVYKQPTTLRIVLNAVRWLGSKAKH